MTEKIVIIDNYDSFTYNLKHLIEETANTNVIVLKNDSLDLTAIENADFIFISPGPGLPEEAGKTLEIIREFGNRKKIMGVCLGLQAIAVAFGGRLKPLDSVYHGIQSEMYYTEYRSSIFKHIPDKLMAGRYHSWVADPIDFPEVLRITQKDINGNIMALEHISLPIFGVQYHPESIMTEFGKAIIANFLDSDI
jgi:anthranilate synthase component 2